MRGVDADLTIRFAILKRAVEKVCVENHFSGPQELYTVELFSSMHCSFYMKTNTTLWRNEC